MTAKGLKGVCLALVVVLAIPTTAAAAGPTSGKWKGKATGGVYSNAITFKVKGKKVLKFSSGKVLMWSSMTASTASITPCIPYPYGGCWILPDDDPVVPDDPTVPDVPGGDRTVVGVPFTISKAKIYKSHGKYRFKATKRKKMGSMTYKMSVKGVFSSRRRVSGTCKLAGFSDDVVSYRWKAKKR